MTVIRNLIFAALLAIAGALPAAAQTSPNFSFGQVPTVGQWNALFASKQDYLGAPPLLTTGGVMTGPLVTAPSTVNAAGFNVPPGAAPSVPTNGDIWTTSSGMFVRINGVTIGPLAGAGSGTFAATAPLSVSFPASVVTYALNTTANFALSGSNLDLSTINSNVGTFGSSTAIPVLTADAKGRLSAITTVAVIAPAGTLTGTTLAANVVSSSLTSVGTLTAGALGTGFTPVANAQIANPSVTINATLCTLGGSCTITATAASITVSSTLILSGADKSILFQNGASPTGTLGEIATANNAVLGTNGTGVWSASATLPSGLAIPTATASALTVTGSFTATGLVTNADLVNASVTVSGTPCTLGSTCSPASVLVIGSSSVTSGTNGFILFNNAGTLDNKATTGTGNVVLGTAPTISSLTVTTAFTATGLVTAADLFGTTGSGGNVVLATAPTISALTVTGSFTATGLVTAADLFGTSGTGNVALVGGPTFTGSPALSTATATSVAIGGCTIGANAFCVTGSSAIGTLTSAAHTITSAAAAALAVGLNGATNPALLVDDSTASSATGISIKSAAAAAGVAVSVISSGTNESGTLNAKGSGTLSINSTATGSVILAGGGGGVTISSALTYGGVPLSNAVTGTGNMVLSASPTLTGTIAAAALTLSTPLNLASGGTNASLTASNGGIVYSDATKLQILAGTSTAGLCLLSSNLTAPVWGSCSGAAAVSSVTNSDGTLTISPTTGSVVASLALGHVNTWTGAQTFNSTKLILAGSSSGTTTLNAAAAAGTTTITFPASTGTVALVDVAQTFTAIKSFNNGALVLNGFTSGSTTLTAQLIAGAGTVNLPLSGTLATLDQTDQLVTGGANVSFLSNATGNITVDCGARPLQAINNGGAFTVTVPTLGGSCMLLIVNTASAGAVTFSGFTVGANTGEPLDTVNGHRFLVSIVSYGSGLATYVIKALQ